MSSIEATVADALTASGYGSYMQYARPVIEALTEREQKMFASIVVAGQSMGADGADVHAALAEVGLTPPPLAIAPSTITSDDQEELTSIRHDMASLLERIDKALG